MLYNRWSIRFWLFWYHLTKLSQWALDLNCQYLHHPWSDSFFDTPTLCLYMFYIQSYSMNSPKVPNIDSVLWVTVLAVLTDYRSGSQSLWKVATTHSLPYSTLHHHVQGCKTCSNGHSSQKLVSQAQEDVLVFWYEYQASMAEPLMHTTFQEHVRLLSSKVPSDVWVRHFLSRHATTIIAVKV